eukprot:GHVU01071212.1.p4 GENE.GHVU01071212.1~~GHVU01071212.1.p4  ORF type:complete len:116 (+),score=8.43 GHVU01071212.1:344-691(+)
MSNFARHSTVLAHSFPPMTVPLPGTAGAAHVPGVPAFKHDSISEDASDPATGGSIAAGASTAVPDGTRLPESGGTSSRPPEGELTCWTNDESKEWKKQFAMWVLGESEHAVFLSC